MYKRSNSLLQLVFKLIDCSRVKLNVLLNFSSSFVTNWPENTENEYYLHSCRSTTVTLSLECNNTYMLLDGLVSQTDSDSIFVYSYSHNEKEYVTGER